MPLIGREQELALLLERWEWAKEGEGQVILLDGEPGIGKSRLIRALRERLADEAYIPLSHYCSPYHTNSPLIQSSAYWSEPRGSSAKRLPKHGSTN